MSSFIVTVRRFAAGEARVKMVDASEPFEDRVAARYHADELWMAELKAAQAEAERIRRSTGRALGAIPTALNSDMKAVSLHSEADGVLRSTIICVERAR